MTTKFEDLRKQIESFAIKEGYGTNLPKGLEIYAARLFAQDEGLRSEILAGDSWTDSEITPYLCGASGDSNFDVILYSPDSDRVIAVQAKYRTSKFPKGELLNEVEKLKECLTRIRNKKFRDDNMNQKARELVEESGLASRKKNIGLYLVTNQPVGDEGHAKARCRELSEELVADGYEVEIAIFGSAELLEQQRLYEAADTGRTVSFQEIDFPVDSVFEYVSVDRRALVAMIKGNKVSDLFKEQGAALFNLNIRGYLSSSGINKGIMQTAEDDGDATNFFYYNNGITATCSSYEVLNKSRYRAHDLQIVNGAQTVKSLYRALRERPNSKVTVLFRLIETGEKNRNKNKFADKIARFQNTQNKILDSDFFGNDPIQIWIESNLSKDWSAKGIGSYILPFHYERKRGIGSGPGKKITIQELGKLRHAMIHGPKVAYREAKSLWSVENSDRYWEAFGTPDENGTYVECLSWTEEEAAQAVWALHTWQYLRKESRALAIKNRGVQTTESDSVPEQNYLTNLAIWVVSAVAVAVRASIKAGKQEDFKSIMHSEKTWTASSKIFLTHARVALAREMADLYAQKQANPRLNLPGNEAIWKKIRAEMMKLGELA